MLYPRKVDLNVWLIAASKEGDDLEEALRMNALGHNLTVMASEGEFNERVAGLAEDFDALPHLLMYLIREETTGVDDWILKVKASERFSHVPVIIFYSEQATFDLARLYSCGAASVIRVPVRFQGLVEVMRVIEAYWFKVALTA
ncbi:MAG: hypothetical protein ABJM19_14165 [Marinobacter sp.]|uniref:hypothetical protein n=1 Tax=unclassified Marinobacter TaxID=83889 RepID=UPI00273C2290|nr:MULTISPECIES: hypothetical protein [unclassified Marinobacter]MDP4548099.1 hypothetical protein [Marinobacter sp. MDS2]